MAFGNQGVVAIAMACQLGYTPQHAVFVLLHLASVFWLTARRCHLRASAWSIAAGSYHAGMAVMCESGLVSEARHDANLRNVLFQLRMVYILSLSVSLAWSALLCIKQGAGPFKTVRMAAVTGPVLLLGGGLAFALVWACSATSDVEGTDEPHICKAVEFEKFQAISATSVVGSWVAVLAETRSTTMR